MKLLNKSLPYFILNIVIFGFLSNTLLAWSAGPPAYRTGAPDDAGTCSDVGCHNSYAVNSGSANFSIKAPTNYMAGEVVKIKVAFSNSNKKMHGFEMTAVDAKGNKVGTFKKIGTTTQLIPPNDLRGLQSADNGKYIEQTFDGTRKKSWKFKWTPPSNANDPITFYAAGCAADGNAVVTNDYVYTTTAQINATP